MESVLLLLAGQLESGDAAHQGAQIQPVRFGGLPGDKRHPPDKLQHYFGIELIGLGALQQGFGEIGNGARIGDHDLDPFSPIQSQRQIEAIKTGRFKANLDGRRRLAQPLNQELVPGCGVGKLPPLAASVQALTSIPTKTAPITLVIRRLLLLNWVSGSPTLNRHLPALSRRLSIKGPRILLGMGEEGGGPI
jgi:hypothetical protein